MRYSPDAFHLQGIMKILLENQSFCIVGLEGRAKINITPRSCSTLEVLDS